MFIVLRMISNRPVGWMVAFAGMLSITSAKDAFSRRYAGTVTRLDPPIEVVIPAGSNPRVVAWRQRMGAFHASWLRIHFEEFRFPRGSAEDETRGRLVLQLADGTEVTPYFGDGPEKLLTPDGFWSDELPGDAVELIVYGDSDQSVRLRIDRYGAGIPGEETAGPPPEDGIFDITCLALNDPKYILAKSVARLLVEDKNGDLWYGTGFAYKLPGDSIPPDNMVMTSAHVLDAAVTITAEFMYERRGCTFPAGPEPCAFPTSFAGDPSQVRENKWRDVAVFPVGGHPGTQFGMVELKDERSSTLNNLYIPNHAHGWCKNYCQGCTAVKGLPSWIPWTGRLLYGCPAVGGMSGSPLIDLDDSKVVGVQEGKWGRTGGKWWGWASKAGGVIRWLAKGRLTASVPAARGYLPMKPIATPWGASIPVEVSPAIPGDTMVVASFSFDGGAAQGWRTVNLNAPGVFEDVSAAILSGVGVNQELACGEDLSSLWGFTSPSTVYGCGRYPGIPAIPVAADGADIQSPMIGIDPWKTTILKFRVYIDDPLGDRWDVNLMFYTWRVRSRDPSGEVSAGPWRNGGYCYYGRGLGWRTLLYDITPFIEPGADSIQVALGAIDLADEWAGVFGPGYCHSNAPLFDDVAILQTSSSPGPRWHVRSYHLFQDAFPQNGSLTGTVRTDIALDLRGRSDPCVQPGDSLVAVVRAPVGLGIGELGRAAVYCWVRSTGNHTPMEMQSWEFSTVVGPRYPYVGITYTDPPGNVWYKFQMDSVYYHDGQPTPGKPAALDAYCFDLNDAVFTPPDTVLFFLEATDLLGRTNYWTGKLGTTAHIADAASVAMEMQCLPTGSSRILYVDDASGRGIQPYFDTAFEQLDVHPDRYDVRAPTSMVGNGLASRATKWQLIGAYNIIIWNSGDCETGTIGDGLRDKSEDFFLLAQFLDQHPDTNGVGLYISGDNIAEEWTASTQPGPALLSSYIHFYGYGAHHEASNFPWDPLVIGEPGSLFYHAPGGADSLIASDRCPTVGDLDVIVPHGGAQLAMAYTRPDGTKDGAVVTQTSTNAQGVSVGVVLEGFSFERISADRPSGVLERAEHLRDILQWFGLPVQSPTGIQNTPALVSRLEQNYPNPFNPVTTVEYSLRANGYVSLKIYDVGGRLVRTLEDGPRNAGVHRTIWDGKNNNGEPVSSGVYFMRLATKRFVGTKKLVVLK